MLKWAVATEDRRSNSAKSLRKRRKLGIQETNKNNSVSTDGGRSNNEINYSGELIGGYETRTTHGNSLSSGCAIKHRSVLSSGNSCRDLDGTRAARIGMRNQDIGHKSCTTCTPNISLPTRTEGDGDGDSKSLLYMSLDQLPLVIVKQYERMLQENSKVKTTCNVKDSEAENVPSLSLTRAKSLEDMAHIGRAKVARVRTTNSSSEMIRHAHNRHLKTSNSLQRTTSLASGERRRKSLIRKYGDFKYSNSLSSSSSTSSSDPDFLDCPKKYQAFALSPMKSLSLPKSHKQTKVSYVTGPAISSTTLTNKHHEVTMSRTPFKSIDNVSSKQASTTAVSNSHFHDLTDPEFLEKSISVIIPRTASKIKCAKKLTLKRSELRKLERIRSQTERLNMFLRKYYHDCLPDLPEEEDEHLSPEHKEEVLRTQWSQQKLKELNQKFMLSSENSSNTSDSSTSTSSSSSSGTSNASRTLISAFEGRTVSWRNLNNFTLLSPASDSAHTLPMIQEDTETSSVLSENNNNTSQIPDYKKNNKVEVLSSNNLERNCDNLTSRTTVYDTSSHADITLSKSEAKAGIEGLFGDEPFVKMPTSNHHDHRSDSPHHPSSSSPQATKTASAALADDDDEAKGTDNFVFSNSVRPLPFVPEKENFTHNTPSLAITSQDHETPNYLSKSETWNYHEFSPCEPNSTQSPGTKMTIDDSKPDTDISLRKGNSSHDEHLASTSTGRALTTMAMMTPRRKPRMRIKAKTPTPRKKLLGPSKLVRKPHVSTAYTGKGEVLIRTYSNGDYVTLHVVQAKNLQTCYRSSWKLGIKISLLPEAEETLTKFESIPVNSHQTWVKIDQKFSFEAVPDRKIFFTLWKRLEQGRTSFLGWTTLDTGLNKNTQSWFKLRKKKIRMSTYASTKPFIANTNNNSTPDRPFIQANPSTSGVNGFIPKKGGKNLNETPTRSSTKCYHASPSEVNCDNYSELDGLLMMNGPKQLQTSSTMDSGVEDCCSCEPCEPGAGGCPPVMIQPTNTTGSDSDLEESDGLGPGCRVAVRMQKDENEGFGFSVVWVSPPRIERLEKNKTADLAGLRIGDLIIGVNGEDVSSVPNTTIYHKMKTTGNEIVLDVWRKYPGTNQPYHDAYTANVSSYNPMSVTVDINSSLVTNGNYSCPKPPSSFSSTGSGYSSCLSQSGNGNAVTTTTTTATTLMNNKSASQYPPPRVQPPPVSILKPPPPAPPAASLPPPTITSAQPTSNSSSWKIKFNIELLDNEDDDLLKQFFICELKFFRKVVAALDRYLIPAQANHLLSPQEMHLIFSHLIKIITMTKRTLQCVATGASKSDWQLGKILFSTHSDHLAELTAAYSQYGKNLGSSAEVLANKMTLQIFAKFVLETPVPKGHLDMTSLVFAPLEHLRNLCEITDEIVQSSAHWGDIACQLKDCYADIVCETDFMEPISHISMKKNPLLSVRDLEKRIVSTTGQNFKVGEKGRKWLFGSRLFRKESDGSWASVWAFLFTDIIVLTSHTTRDRVFFVKEPPIRLEDVVTLHFNLPRKNENEFRLLFGPELPHQSRLDKLLPLKNRNKKPNQIVLRTNNIQVKSVWKLLLQRQIITLNTRISKSSSSNFSISEFCEKFPDENHSSPLEEDIPRDAASLDNKDKAQPKCSTSVTSTLDSKTTSSPNHPKSHFLDKFKPSSDSPLPTKHVMTTGSTSEWSSPLEISRNGGGVTESANEAKTYTTNDPENYHLARKDHKVSRAIAGATVGQVKEENVNMKPKRETTVVLTSTETSTPQQTNFNPSIMNSDNLGNVNQNEMINLNRRVTTVGDSSLTKVTSADAIPMRNNNNNNESISDLNDDVKCRCEIYMPVDEKKVELKGSLSESPKSRLDYREKRVQLKETNDRKPDEAEEEKAVSQHYSTNGKEYNRGSVTQGESGSALLLTREPKESFPGKIHNPLLSKGTKEEKYDPSYNRDRSQMTSPKLHQNENLTSVVNNNLKLGQTGTKIKTNATLFMMSRNIEPTEQTSLSTVIRPNYIPDNNDNENRTKSFPREGTEISQHVNSELRTAKQIHTDSPIISGFGSDRSRRRILYDYKIRRDYPELFGITPRDRRSFIKSLAEKVKAEEKGLVAPYYYMTPSPLPIPKHIRNLQLQQERQQQEKVIPPEPPAKISPQKQPCQSQKSPLPKPSRIPVSLSERSKIQASILARKEAEWQAHLNKFAEANRLRGNTSTKPSQEILEDLLEDETEGPVALSNLVRGRLSHGRQRSPEESSSNDSGISEEMPIDKFKLNKKLNNRTVNESCLPKSRVDSTSSTTKLSTAEVNTSHFHSTSSSSTSCTSVKNNPAHMCPASASSSISSVNVINSPMSVLYEGGSTAPVETVVALKMTTTTAEKADKATTTEDYITNTQPVSDKSFNRNIMAQRREAFFLHGQSTPTSSPSIMRRNNPSDDNLFKVKIFPGNSVQQSPAWTNQPLPGTSSMFTGKPWISCDHVKYTRLEKENKARIERVESSDDSTSSDVASASPAPENENGTTDPSWSSSSSSLTGGYSNSKEGNTVASTQIKTFSALEDGDSHSAPSVMIKPIVPAYYHLTKGPEIVVTKDSSPELRSNCDNSEDELSDDIEDKGSHRSVANCNGYSNSNPRNGSSSSSKSGGPCSSSGNGGCGLLRVESNDSTVENYGDDDEEYNFEEDEEDDLSHCSLATINRYGTYESLEKIEADDTLGGLPEFSGTTLPRSKARFTFEEDDEDDVIDDENLFEEDFESDFNFRFPSQVQDHTYSVSRLGPLPPLLEEDFEDDMYDENGSSSNSPCSSSDKGACGSTISTAIRPSKQEAGLRHDNSFLLTRIASMYARSSISPLKILRELWLKKRYREWAYKE